MKDVERKKTGVTDLNFALSHLFDGSSDRVTYKLTETLELWTAVTFSNGDKLSENKKESSNIFSLLHPLVQNRI